jgi:hypothetical protein
MRLCDAKSYTLSIRVYLPSLASLRISSPSTFQDGFSTSPTEHHQSHSRQHCLSCLPAPDKMATDTAALPEPPGLGQNQVSPFVPADQLPVQRNAPLAPSQELAYREKCIALKRRIMEIEAENDAKRARISKEKDLHAKMRLNRAILMDKLRELMESRGGQPKTRQELMEMLGFDQLDGDEEDQTYEQLQAQSNKRRRVQTRDEEMLDDMSEDTDDQDPEVCRSACPHFLPTNHHNSQSSDLFAPDAPTTLPPLATPSWATLASPLLHRFPTSQSTACNTPLQPTWVACRPSHQLRAQPHSPTPTLPWASLHHPSKSAPPHQSSRSQVSPSAS